MVFENSLFSMPPRRWPRGPRWCYFLILAAFAVGTGQMINWIFFDPQFGTPITLQGAYSSTMFVLFACAIVAGQRGKMMGFAVAASAGCLLNVFVTGYWEANHLIAMLSRGRFYGGWLLAWNTFVIVKSIAIGATMLPWLLREELAARVADKPQLARPSHDTHLFPSTAKSQPTATLNRRIADSAHGDLVDDKDLLLQSDS